MKLRYVNRGVNTGSCYMKLFQTVVVVPDTVGSDCGITKLKQRFTANNIKHFNSVLKIKPDNFAQPNVKCNIKSDIVLLPYSRYFAILLSSILKGF